MRYLLVRALCLAAAGGAPILPSPACADIIVGAGPGGLPQVSVYGPAGGLERSFLAYGSGFTGGVRVAAGDITGDGIPDVITGSGAGAPGGHVKVFDGATGAEVRSFLAYDAGYSGGVQVASGDVDGDGRPDIVTATSSVSSHVKVFSGATGAEIRSFFAYTPSFSGGVRVAVGDFNRDSFIDIVAASGSGSAAPVRVFDGLSLATIRSFDPYTAGFAGGVYVAAGDVNGDGIADIMTGPGGDDTPSGAAPNVKVFDGLTLAQLDTFFAYPPTFLGGVRVAAGDLNGDGVPDIIAGAGPTGGPHVRAFSGADLSVLQDFLAFSPDFQGGIYVAATPVPAPALAVPVLGLLALARRPARR